MEDTNMEKYAACVNTSESSIQIVITLPQSKIGYTYPEVYLCTPQKHGSLKYAYIDITTGTAWKSDAETFIPLYVHADLLTEEKFKEIGIFKGTLQETAEALIEMFRE